MPMSAHASPLGLQHVIVQCAECSVIRCNNAHEWTTARCSRTIITVKVTVKVKVTVMPRDYDDAWHAGLTSQINHPDRLVDVEVIKYSTSVYAVVCVSVNCTTSVTMNPASGFPPGGATVSLVLWSSAGDERLLLIRHVRYCHTATPFTIMSVEHSCQSRSCYAFSTARLEWRRLELAQVMLVLSDIIVYFSITKCYTYYSPRDA